MRSTPSSTARRSTRTHSARSAGSPQMPLPVMRMAPKPRRCTLSSPRLKVPEWAIGRVSVAFWFDMLPFYPESARPEQPGPEAGRRVEIIEDPTEQTARSARIHWQDGHLSTDNDDDGGPRHAPRDPGPREPRAFRPAVGAALGQAHIPAPGGRGDSLGGTGGRRLRFVDGVGGVQHRERRREGRHGGRRRHRVDDQPHPGDDPGQRLGGHLVSLHRRPEGSELVHRRLCPALAPIHRHRRLAAKGGQRNCRGLRYLQAGRRDHPGHLQRLTALYLHRGQDGGLHRRAGGIGDVVRGERLGDTGRGSGHHRPRFQHHDDPGPFDAGRHPGHRGSAGTHQPGSDLPGADLPGADLPGADLPAATSPPATSPPPTSPPPPPTTTPTTMAYGY